MPNKKISELTAAGALTGAELIETVQGGVNVKTTTQDIANLGGGGGAWGSITGTLSDQTDLQNALNDKADAGATIVTDTGAYTLQASDLTLINAGATLIIDGDGTGDLTVPLNATVAFPNCSIGVRDYNNIIATGGVTITGTRGDLTVPTGMTVILEKIATNTWILHNGAETSISDVTGLQTALDAKLAHTNSAVALVDGATIDLTATKHTLASSSATRTFTISYAGDDITMEVTLSNTAATYTFPAAALCVSEGVASGDNTMDLAGVSGDKYIIAIKKIGSNYFAVCKNFGQ